MFYTTHERYQCALVSYKGYISLKRYIQYHRHNQHVKICDRTDCCARGFNTTHRYR